MELGEQLQISLIKGWISVLNSFSKEYQSEWRQRKSEITFAGICKPFLHQGKQENFSIQHRFRESEVLLT